MSESASLTIDAPRFARAAIRDHPAQMNAPPRTDDRERGKRNDEVPDKDNMHDRHRRLESNNARKH